MPYIISIPNNVLHNTFCDVCFLSKQHRQPFTKSAIYYIRIIELLHMDLWGPFKWVFLRGAYYILINVDNYSRSIWTYLLPNKVVIASIIINFIGMIENQFQSKVQKIRTDNGGKFLYSNAFMVRAFCIRKHMLILHNRLE